LAGKRWDKYFLPGRPYLDGYQADFITGPAVMAGYKSGRIAAEFRGVTCRSADDLVEGLGDRVDSESPWLSNLLVVFNTKRAPSTILGMRALALPSTPCGGEIAGHDLSNMSAASCGWLEHGHPATHHSRFRATSPPHAPRLCSFSTPPGCTI
jgi:hypothetical protein